MTVGRNILMGLGSYYLAQWLQLAIDSLLALTIGLHVSYREDSLLAIFWVPLWFDAALIAMAALAGFLVATFAAGAKGHRWALVPAGLFLVLEAINRRSFQAQDWRDWLIGSAMPGLYACLACVIGAVVTARRPQRVGTP